MNTELFDYRDSNTRPTNLPEPKSTQGVVVDVATEKSTVEQVEGLLLTAKGRGPTTMLKLERVGYSRNQYQLNGEPLVSGRRCWISRKNGKNDIAIRVKIAVKVITEEQSSHNDRWTEERHLIGVVLTNGRGNNERTIWLQEADLKNLYFAY